MTHRTARSGVARSCLAVFAATILAVLASGSSVRAGQPELLVAILTADQVVEHPDRVGLMWGSGTAVLSRGSDAGTICYQLAVDMGGFPGDNMLWSTSIAHAPPGVDGTGVALLGSWSLGGEMHTGCVGSLDPAVVSDLFANPHDYYVSSSARVSPSDTGCESPTNCPDIALRGQLAVGGADCQVMAASSAAGEPMTTLTVGAGQSLWLIGSGFIPWATTEILFTPGNASMAPKAFFLTADNEGSLANEFTSASLGAGHWTVSAPDLGCEETLSATVLAGAALPDTAAPATVDATPDTGRVLAALLAMLAIGMGAAACGAALQAPTPSEENP